MTISKNYGTALKNNLVQTLRLDRPNEILHAGIHLRRERRQFFDLYADGFKNRIESFVEKRIAIMDQVFFPQHETVPHIAHVSGNLCSPVAVRIMNNTSQAYFPAADVHKKQQALTNQSEWSQTFDLSKIR